ncbi:arf-GAP with dual PH domain-containing protein 1-like isoform 4-T4 [Clarias gariepinus]|uniref:arf-GAP with dual PH domain-containing protein 1-like isoform X4 n=1 Tax=Clarias gariepinus TaxID=13013 RepID=UPI00234DEE73|nr:arf-GAP with dual PH domain-containing protein 1-like isoform X4 [Clarias gariepinus]
MSRWCQPFITCQHTRTASCCGNSGSGANMREMSLFMWRGKSHTQQAAGREDEEAISPPPAWQKIPAGMDGSESRPWHTQFKGYREGFLWKRGRDNSQFLSRKFILSEREGAMKYFNKHDAREPKALMKIQTINATFQPTKIGHPHGLQITYMKDNSTRNIFVYHEDGKEIVDWFNAIRAARFHYLQVAFPGASDTELVTKLTRNYIKEGYMEKTGPKQTEGFKRRWFTLDDRRIMYFKDPLDAYARGEVFIGSKESGYTVVAGLPPSTQGYHWQFGITIVTPDRKFLFACEKEEEQKEWITVFQSVINRPMLPQEYAVEAHFKHKP